ncbi:hypothetical protein P171DRAFT_479461 [Karstenula rhodostoma CBS 690.94]|uniref:Acid protease n=1 Tax=Karstenula rhodostoma CBS 690.94 TaxID=1392251 RepID=A0A9P4UH81_9PLEO|nr:hypothetical protein P171DRAFT_479461 [Karstenula rhodostoma CBS 690.94]
MHVLQPIFITLVLAYSQIKGVLGIPGSAAPLVISSSGGWDGPDGPWSSFDLGAGSNIQAFRGFPALSQSLYILPHQTSWCGGTDQIEICERRGSYQAGDSTSWKEAGVYDLGDDLSPFTLSGYPPIAYLGLDTIIWGKTSIDPQFERQWIAQIVSEDFPMALIGLGTGVYHLPNGTDGGDVTSPIVGLRENGTIPSITYGYNAGSFYRNQTASLILGGYDSARIKNLSASASFSMPSNQNTTLIAKISSVGLNTNLSGNPTELDTPFLARIESAVPQFYLPLNICHAFEEAFGLTWDSTLLYYTVNESSHKINIQRNSSVTFSIGENDQVTKLTFPYQAFDLQLSYPLIKEVNTSI